MNKFQKFDEVLTQVDHPVYWEDDMLDYSRDLRETFDEEDWNELERVFSHKNPRWQARCAQALDGDLSERSFKILAFLLQSADCMTIVHSIYSLLSFEKRYNLVKYVSAPTYEHARSVLANEKGIENLKSEYLTQLDALFSDA